MINMDNVHPHKEELDYLQKQIADAWRGGNHPYLRECMDRVYALYFNTSLAYSKYISQLQEGLEKAISDEEQANFGKLLSVARITFSHISDALKSFQEYQQRTGLTNAPSE